MQFSLTFLSFAFVRLCTYACTHVHVLYTAVTTASLLFNSTLTLMYSAQCAIDSEREFFGIVRYV
jgi:hypothetical protein